jgi:hypothetical protein
MSVAISTGAAIAIGLGAGTAAGTIYAANKASGATTQAAATESAAATQAAQLQTQAAEKAAQLQYQSAQDALNFAKSVYTTKQGQVSPYIGMGQGALSALGSYLGVSPVAQPPVSFPASSTPPPSALTPTTTTPVQQWANNPAGGVPGGSSLGTTFSTGFNSGDPSTWGISPAQFAANTAKQNPDLTQAQVNQLVYGNAAGASTSGVVQPGTQRTINGQLAQWDGQGWAAVGS